MLYIEEEIKVIKGGLAYRKLLGCGLIQLVEW